MKRTHTHTHDNSTYISDEICNAAIKSGGCITSFPFSAYSPEQAAESAAYQEAVKHVLILVSDHVIISAYALETRMTTLIENAQREINIIEDDDNISEDEWNTKTDAITAECDREQSNIIQDLDQIYILITRFKLIRSICTIRYNPDRQTVPNYWNGFITRMKNRYLDRKEILEAKQVLLEEEGQYILPAAPHLLTTTSDGSLIDQIYTSEEDINNLYDNHEDLVETEEYINLSPEQQDKLERDYELDFRLRTTKLHTLYDRMWWLKLVAGANVECPYTCVCSDHLGLYSTYLQEKRAIREDLFNKL